MVAVARVGTWARRVCLPQHMLICLCSIFDTKIIIFQLSPFITNLLNGSLYRFRKYRKK